MLKLRIFQAEPNNGLPFSLYRGINSTDLVQMQNHRPNVPFSMFSVNK